MSKKQVYNIISYANPYTSNILFVHIVGFEVNIFDNKKSRKTLVIFLFIAGTR